MNEITLNKFSIKLLLLLLLLLLSADGDLISPGHSPKAQMHLYFSIYIHTSKYAYKYKEIYNGRT